MNREDIKNLMQEAGLKAPARGDFIFIHWDQIAMLLEHQRKVWLQLFTDPENQPTQYGTVTVEYMEKFMAAERQMVVDSLKKQAELAADDYDRRWALEMAAAVAARGQK